MKQGNDQDEMVNGIWEREVMAAAMHQCMPHPRALKPGSWEFSLVNGKPFNVRARIESRWMVFETHDIAWGPGNCWPLLELNSKLGVGTRFVLHPHHLSLRTELLLFEEIDLIDRLRFMRDELRTGMGLLHELHSNSKPPEIATHDLDPPVFRDDLSGPSINELCENSGWPGNERDGASVVVSLEVDRGFYQANITREAHGRLHLSWELPTYRGSSGEQNGGERERLWTTPMAHFLLQVSARLRLVRAEVVQLENESEDEERAGQAEQLRFTALLPADANVGELHEAFANLSMACDLTANETVALRSSRLASRYLQMHEHSAPIRKPL
ncbi:MAG TPA: hypothetical protein VJ023_21975 [Pyrinomonadaceae bacterium]|nr:hypothetical protein [Pyrinomonadaceae bacterium]